MKKLVLILILFFSVTSYSQGIRLRKMMFTHNLTPIASYTNRLHVNKGVDTLTIHSLGIGIGLTKGDLDMYNFPLTYRWKYLALPYLKLDFNFANRKGNGQLFNPL